MDDQEFIEEELREWGGKVRREMMLSLDRMGAVQSGSLKRGINFFVKGKEWSLVFKTYGRFVDMGVGRGVPIGKKGTAAFDKSRNSNGKLKNYSRKAKKFYSKTAYGMLGQLHDGLLKGYGDKIIDGIKNDLET